MGEKVFENANSKNNPDEGQAATSQSNDHHFIGTSQKAPQFMVDNTHITDGYRINFNTPSKIIKSLFMIHNESINIWSHCLPAVFFCFILISFLLVVDTDSIKINFAHHRAEIEDNLHEFHKKLKNISISNEIQKYGHEAQQELKSLKISLLSGYEELLETVSQRSANMRQLLQSNIEEFKTTFTENLINRLQQFEKSKIKFQNQIAPKFIENFQNNFNGQFLTYIKQHLNELKQHLDSKEFELIQLHKNIPNPHHVSKWPVFVFLLTAVICLLNSTVFHLFHPISSKTYGLLLRFDFAGISLLIAGSAFPSFYYGLYCQMAVATIYISWTFLAAIACFVICLFQWIHKQGNQIYRSVVFGSFGFSMAVPLSHMVINQLVFDNHGDPYQFSSSGIYYILLISSYIFGLYVFTVRCPERNNPGRYNICGHSHQIWHLMVVLGVVFTYFGVMENFEMRKVSFCPA